MPTILVHGHRGCRAVRPENTLPAFQHAIEVGVDALEMDLDVTKDGVLVVSHDPFVNPVICRGPGLAAVPSDIAIRSLTLAQLGRYDCGAV
ncbi:MAG TPA: glycerophosphodiester phosphodiesterase family protein, partial [Bryobacterales bacterium]|nr:glycerophosphodiester phosphodiesterase family protein [Bryobacterales bacterium]